VTPGQFWVSSGAASLLWYFGTADSWLAYYFHLEQKQLMSDFVDAYCLQKSRFSVVLFQLHGCLQLIDYWSIWQYKFTHFWCNHNCRLIMPALQKKYSSTSILAELSTEWQYWLTSLGSLKVLLMWNLLKLKLFRKLLSWTSQSCMAANSRWHQRGLMFLGWSNPAAEVSILTMATPTWGHMVIVPMAMGDSPDSAAHADLIFEAQVSIELSAHGA